MNQVHPKTLLHSKWTRANVEQKEKHYLVTDVEFDENHKVVRCVIEAVINRRQFELNWRELKDPELWQIGWK